MPFDREKLEWCSYPVVKNLEDMFTHFDRIYKRDRQTATHTHTHTHTHTYRMTAKALDAIIIIIIRWHAQR